MQVVWFKRDLRVVDHEALAESVRCGPVLPLYVLEPELWQQTDLSRRQYQFLCDSLDSLNNSLRGLGQELVIKVGDIVEILNNVHARHNIQALWSHQETWNGWTYERDKRVQKWASENAVPWHQPAQNGVIRRLKQRNGWSACWNQKMNQPLHSSPVYLQPVNESSESLPHANVLGLKEDGCVTPQAGGRSKGLKLLHSFLEERGEGYTREMSSPLTAFDSCSRLSTHLAFGTLSMREIYQEVEARRLTVKQKDRDSRGSWLAALNSFSGRLRWRCHFMQKLEDEPRIEFENMHPSYDGLREYDFNEAHFEAWKTGKTGYPMIDACMRALTATGWLNFRMRAMLMSFAAYNLWLHWRKPALHMAALFSDYEPGIHYSQVQMQSATTGINTVRIYNPTKQGMDHDPEGLFIRRWVPELREVDTTWIHTPWNDPKKVRGYPLPIVDEIASRKSAAARIYSLRKCSDYREIASNIAHKHGSRKSGLIRVSDRKPQHRTYQPRLAL